METWKERLQIEFSDLDQKLTALRSYILSEAFDALPEIDRKDLKEQHRCMTDYFNVLVRRVSRGCNNA